MTEGPVEPEQDLATPPDPKPGGSVAAWIFGGWIGALMAVVIVAAWLVGKDEGKRQAANSGATKVAAAPAKTTTAAEPTAPAGPGKQLFVTKCGGCHTLKAAGTTGTTGPNLNDLMPDAALVESAIHNGGAGSGAMPKGLAAGEEAKQIADFVSKAAAG